MTDDHDKPAGGEAAETPPATTTPLDEQWGDTTPPPEAAPEAAPVTPPADTVGEPVAPAPDGEAGAAPEPVAPAPDTAAELEPGVPAPEPRATLADIVAADAEAHSDASATTTTTSRGGGDDDDDRDAPRPRRKLDWSLRRTRIAAGLGVGSVLLAVIVVLSWINSRDYYLVCGAEKIFAERGSKFPWGRTALAGKEWRAIEIPPESQCESKTFATLEELREVFAQALLDEASHRLISARPEDIDVAERQLEQALLLTRSMPTKRATIANLQGDVEYWRAASQVKSVIDALDDAAARFEAAAAKKPRHSTDASEWSSHAAETAKQLRSGPRELRTDIDVGPNTPPPFAGTATAPAPPRDDAPPTGPPAEPTAPAGAALPTQPDIDAPPRAAERPDAGMPTGGVLL